MSELSQAIQDAPLASMIPLGLLTIVGLLLWAAGRKLLRASFAAVGLVLGAGCGWLLGEAVNLGVPAGAIAIIFGVVAACVAALVFRLALAVALALVLGVASPLAVVTVAELQGTQFAPDELVDDEEEILDEDDGSPTFPIDDSSDWLERESAELAPDLAKEFLGDEFELSDETKQQLEDAQSYAKDLIEAAKAEWDATPPRLRTLIVAAAIGGFLAGLLIGTLASSFTATVVSSVGGALLWLSCLRVVLLHFDGSVAQWLPSTAFALTLTWLITSMLGMVIQWTFRPKKADKPA